VARRLLLAAASVIALTSAGFTSAAYAAPAAPGAAASRVTTARACPTLTRGHAACTALRRTDSAATAATQRMARAMAAARPGAKPNATPSGYGPKDLQSAYDLPVASGTEETVAIVDAYNDPTAEADLGVYRQQFNLPACTTANGCFGKVNQTGGTSYPSTDAGWAEEISLDLDMVSATCPLCHILLVETTSSSLTNLGTGVNTAARMGAVAISNSYGGGDLPDSFYGSYYRHPGIAVTASSGDGGYGVEFPASSHYVTAVGGTSLTRSASNARGWTESAWSGAGSGCSRYSTAVAPSNANTGCSRRAVADVSAVADPATGVAVYDTTVPSGTTGGWLVFGGTSASSPIIASVYALSGNTGGTANTIPYQHPSGLFDVTTGSNGSCSPSQLCHARAGWDGPTGLGTPNGTTAF
jgi:subtilase family serine protease